MNKTALDLQQRVLALIARGTAQPTSDDEFNELARAIFAFQYERCETYRAYCDRLKLTPQTVEHWKQIPAVPTSAFKDFALTCFPVEEAVAEFHTSGTTREKSGRHFFRTLELYEAAICPNFERASPRSGKQPKATGGRPLLNANDGVDAVATGGVALVAVAHDGCGDARVWRAGKRVLRGAWSVVRRAIGGGAARSARRRVNPYSCSEQRSRSRICLMISGNEIWSLNCRMVPARWKQADSKAGRAKCPKGFVPDVREVSRASFVEGRQ